MDENGSRIDLGIGRGIKEFHHVFVVQGFAEAETPRPTRLADGVMMERVGIDGSMSQIRHGVSLVMLRRHSLSASGSAPGIAGNSGACASICAKRCWLSIEIRIRIVSRDVLKLPVWRLRVGEDGGVKRRYQEAPFDETFEMLLDDVVPSHVVLR